MTGGTWACASSEKPSTQYGVAGMVSRRMMELTGWICTGLGAWWMGGGKVLVNVSMPSMETGLAPRE
jgi:hypothetical protein